MLFCFNAAEVFQIAIEIEENGKVFYEKAQQLIPDAEVKALFADLATQEVEHKKRFEMLKAQLPQAAGAATVSDPNDELYAYLRMMADQHVFVSGAALAEQLAQIKTGTDALKLAIQFEKDSVLFFLSMQDATCDDKGRDLIQLLVKEEQEHLKRLSLQLHKLGR
jgi:rubrerythrin